MALTVYKLPDRYARIVDLEWYRSLRDPTAGMKDAAEVVGRVIADVEREGDVAVARYMQQWTDPGFAAGSIRVDPYQIEVALDRLDPMLRSTLERAIDNVRAYQQHIKPAEPSSILLNGAELGLRFTPMDSVGLAVPGGRASYPSSVVMLAVPALVAGVPADAISVVTPPPTRPDDHRVQHVEAADVSALVLAACALLGISRVYRVGGAQGIAALALGTETIEPVDLIAGPGNIYTQLAKLQLAGRVGDRWVLWPQRDRCACR